MHRTKPGDGGRDDTAAPSAVVVLDRQVLADLADGADEEDLQMLRGVVASYCSGRLVAQARRALDAGDWEACERGAHSLKGLGAMLGAMAVAAAAAELERSAELRDAAACRAELGRVAAEHRRSHRALAATELYDPALVEQPPDD